MTAEAIADQFNARRVGLSRWMARCPGHSDREPSLSIREGRDGRTLLNCFAGCTPTAVLKAAGLHLSDLFPGPPPSPAEMRKAAQVRAARSSAAQARRQAARTARTRYRKLQAVCDSLGAKLALLADDVPDGDELTRLFHSTLSRLREAEQAVSE